MISRLAQKARRRALRPRYIVRGKFTRPKAQAPGALRCLPLQNRQPQPSRRDGAAAILAAAPLSTPPMLHALMARVSTATPPKDAAAPVAEATGQKSLGAPGAPERLQRSI